MKSLELVICVILLAAALADTSKYPQYYAEELCHNTSSHPIIQLESSGWNSTGILALTRNPTYTLGLDCTLSIQAPAGHGVVISIADVGLRYNYDGTCVDFLKIDELYMCAPMHYSSEWKSFINKEGTFKFRVKTDKDGTSPDDIGFKLSFTSVAQGSMCNNVTDFFQCDTKEEEKRCIWKELTCDGHNNCENNSDEWDIGGANCNPDSVLFLPLFLVFIFIGAGLAFGYFFYKNRRRRGYSRAI